MVCYFLGTLLCQTTCNWFHYLANSMLIHFRFGLTTYANHPLTWYWREFCLKTGPFNNARQLQHISNKLMNSRTLIIIYSSKIPRVKHSILSSIGTNFATLSCTVAISENVSCHLSNDLSIKYSQRWPLRNQWIIKGKRILILVWLQPNED